MLSTHSRLTADLARAQEAGKPGNVAIFSRKQTGGMDDWGTPQALFDELDREFAFTVDAAANADNTKCPRWFGPGSSDRDDALAGKPWTYRKGAYWLNPPYSLAYDFVQRAAQEIKTMEDCAIIAMLLPSRTDTKWFHQFVWDEYRHRCRPGVSIRFLRGRLKFELPAGRLERGGQSAPFPSMIVVLQVPA